VGAGLSTEESRGTGVARRESGTAAAARKRAALELVVKHSSSLRRTAQRYSLCGEDAEDAFQRALEIVLTKAPDVSRHEVLRWTHTVVKHEALALRANRQRLLGAAPRRAREEGGEDWVSLLPAAGDGLDERLERRELIARSREALRRLKPAELRALTLLAEGYSYAEIGEITGFSRTKVNRCLAEGRERFRDLISRSEDGTLCAEMQPRLSALCDGELSSADADAVREHLRACTACRAAMRAYRAAPAAAGALLPAIPLSRSLLERLQELAATVHVRLPGTGPSGEGAVTQVAAAGGTRGVGMAALAKLLAVCAGTAGGAACVAAGVAPPLPLTGDAKPPLERASRTASETTPPVEYRPAPPAPAPQPAPAPKPEREQPPQTEPEPAAPSPEPVEAGAVEYTPPPPPSSAPPASASSGSGEGSAAGEFGP
jgi:RNA polymerase sigma factor (sigma-70 family)